MDSKKSVSERIAYYEQRRNDILSGKIKPIPFFGLPRLTKYIPGIIPGMLYKVISGSGTGKTNFSKYAFVFQPIFYAIKYNVNFQVIYFALEESEQEFIDGLFIHILKRVHGVTIDLFSLSGMTTTPVTEDVLEAIKKAEKQVTQIMSYIKIVDNCYTPDAIYNKCRSLAKTYGKFVENTITKEEEYVPNDPSQVVLVVTDHLSLIEEQYDKDTNTFLTHHKSISKWHTKYLRKIITKQWKWAGLNIQQLALEAEKQQYTTKGDSILSKIMPTLEGVADNKTVVRDDQIVIGLFAPERFGLETFRGFDISNHTPESFGDKFRSIKILKSRFGTPNVESPLFFDGSYNYWEELPLPTDPDFKTKMDKYYKLLKK